SGYPLRSSSSYSRPERASEWLSLSCPLSRLATQPDRDTVPLTHEFLADMLGVQRSTVSSITRSLQQAGFIRQGRGAITVTDRTGLEGASCECYGTVRRSFERLLPHTYRTITTLDPRSQRRCS
ncbi:helix-turn-helix domain-containing protein, partial [Microvirga arabica]